MILTWLGAGGLLLAAGASAEEYSIVEGSFTDAVTGESAALTGGLEIELPGTPLADNTSLHIIADFEFQAGDQTFFPRLPVEYDGQLPIAFLQASDQINFGPDGVGLFRIRSGGDLVEVKDDEVTFRYFDFESTDASSSSVSGPLPSSELPRRFALQGSLYQVDQSFRIYDRLCPPIRVPPPFAPPPPGGRLILDGGGVILRDGGVIASGGGDLILRSSASIGPSAGQNVPTRVTGGGISLIGWGIGSDPDAHLYLVDPSAVGIGEPRVVVNPARTRLDDPLTSTATLIVAAAHVLPTLEELNIGAPDGAEISFDDDGLLTVESSGDLTLSGSPPEIPGLTTLRIVAGGDITVLGIFGVPPGVSLEISTAGMIVIPGGVDPRIRTPGGNIGIRAGGTIEILDRIDPPILTPGGDIEIRAGGTIRILDRIDPTILTPGCDVIVLDGLRPIHPAEKTELGNFSITASAATQVAIDVRPWLEPNKLRLGTRQRIWVALLGSQDLDASDVDPSTLRLGLAEAEPLTRRFGDSPLSFLLEINRDAERHRDLLTLFDVHSLGVAYGDTELCLSAQTYSGAILEGCDSIDAMPTRLKKSTGRHWFKSHRRGHHRRK